MQNLPIASAWLNTLFKHHTCILCFLVIRGPEKKQIQFFKQNYTSAWVNSFLTLAFKKHNLYKVLSVTWYFLSFRMTNLKPYMYDESIFFIFKIGIKKEKNISANKKGWQFFISKKIDDTNSLKFCEEKMSTLTLCRFKYPTTLILLIFMYISSLRWNNSASSNFEQYD